MSRLSLHPINESSGCSVTLPKIIAVGDDNQFKAISSGDCLRQFINLNCADCKNGEIVASDVSNHKQNNVFELNEIRRQKVDWMRDASVEFSQLNTCEALSRYENNGRIHRLEGNEVASVVAEKYLEYSKGRTIAVLCYKRDDCRKINETIHFLKQERGELGTNIATINGRAFAAGEKIMFLENNKLFDVKNGQTCTVKSFHDGILTVQSESGIKNIDTKEYDKVDHAYAMTLHKSQGKTFDNVIVVADKMMDASATYVAMTRHRENVDLYYKKSDFGSFKELANSASKYIQKDSLVDYRNIENINRSRVYEYKEMLLETSSLLKDINTGEASWSDYRKLKESCNSLGKEILQNYDSHKLYLNQIGVTKEKLEISVGVKQRPLTNVELNAKNTVELYAKTALETHALYEEMKKETFNITQHENYQKYSEIRDSRDELAGKILSNYPLHREFVASASNGCSVTLISKKCMENQVKYADQRHELAAKASGFESTARKEVGLYAQYNSETTDLYKKMKSEVYNIAKHPEYAKYKEIRDLRNDCAEKILGDYPMYKKVFEEVSAEQKISLGQLKSQVKYAEQAREQEAKLRSFEQTARKEVMTYVDYNNQSQILYVKMQQEQGAAIKIKSHPDYEKYSQIRDARNDLARKIIADYPSYKDVVDSLRSEYGISKTWMENQIKYADRTKGDSKMLEKPEMTKDNASFMSASGDFFQKLEAAKNDQITKYPYEGSTVADRIKLEKSSDDYELKHEIYLGNFDYAPHVSKSMMFAYCGEHNVSNDLHKGDFAHEYASIIAHQKMEAANLKEPTLKMTEDSIKQALCFQALKRATGEKELTPETFAELNAKAEILSEHITKENVHVLNDRKLMQEANAVIFGKDTPTRAMAVSNMERVIFLNENDLRKEEYQMHKVQELERAARIERANEFDIGR